MTFFLTWEKVCLACTLSTQSHPCLVFLNPCMCFAQCREPVKCPKRRQKSRHQTFINLENCDFFHPVFTALILVLYLLYVVTYMQFCGKGGKLAWSVSGHTCHATLIWSYKINGAAQDVLSVPAVSDGINDPIRYLPIRSTLQSHFVLFI